MRSSQEASVTVKCEERGAVRIGVGVVPRGEIAWD